MWSGSAPYQTICNTLQISLVTLDWDGSLLEMEPLATKRGSMNRNDLRYYREVAAFLDAKAKANGDKLNLYERWRLHYCNKPYLFFETDAELLQRAFDAANNVHFLGESGKIEARSPIDKHWFQAWQTFQETVEEMTRRGIHYSEIMRGKNNFAPYFKHGEPIGMKLLDGVDFRQFEMLLKFSKREYVQDMLNYGRFRISPASSYDTPAYNIAMADVEIERSYRISLITEFIDGIESIDIKGKKVPVSQGYIQVGFPLPDYFLFSTCGIAERRMPTDFNADSALLIQQPKEFMVRMKAALHRIYPTWQFVERPVTYYDNYKSLKFDRDHEFYKDFKFAYQTEHRIILRPNGLQHYQKLEPFFVEIGDLGDIAEALII